MRPRLRAWALTAMLNMAWQPWVHAGQHEAWVQSLHSAQAALAAGDFQRAYTLYQAHATHNPLAQFVMGQFHQHGWGRAADPALACKWFEKAASQGVPRAAHQWGDCLAGGLLGKTDVPAAVRWYERAAADGHLMSLCSAADLLIRGEGIEQDAPRGMAMCMRAAQARVPSAMLLLGRHLEQGRFVPQDLAAARHWFEQAAQLRVAEAQFRLGMLMAEGQGGQVDLNAALFWLEQAASEGHVPAYLPTAWLYGNAPVQAATGALAPEHLAKAYLWAKAAEARHTDRAQLERARQLEANVLAVMPATWRPALDRKVAEHLSRFAAVP